MSELVSIVIPVHNGIRFIRNCIKGVLEQTYCDIEVIVVDDGSSDGLEQMAEELTGLGPGVRYIRIGNSGVTAARKRGVDEASGDWICFLDVDDSMPCDAIEKYSAYFGRHPDIIASGETPLLLEEYKCGLMRRKSHPELWGKMFRAAFIKMFYPPLDRSVIIGEDQTINLVLANYAEKLETIPDLLYHYNLDNPESVTKRFCRTADYEISFERLFDALVRPGFEPYSDALRLAEYKMKIEGFKMVVMDGNRFDAKCGEWRLIKEYYDTHREQFASSERLLVALDRAQWLFELIIRVRLKMK